MVDEITTAVQDIQKQLLSLKSESLEQYDAVDKAQEGLSRWEKEELHVLRKVFE